MKDQSGGDVMSREQRSRLMSRIRGRDTKPEIIVRKALFALGFRYRLHQANLPGRPDIVFSKRKAVILVHGCYWHGHECHLFRYPHGNAEFWRTKIGGNIVRDRRNREALLALGWRVLTVWECAIRGKRKLGIEVTASACARWLHSDECEASIEGLLS